MPEQKPQAAVPTQAAAPKPMNQNPQPSAAANTAAAVQNVIEWIDTTVKASDAPGEFVAAGWSEGRAIDPRTILNAAAKAVTASVTQQTASQSAPPRNSSSSPQPSAEKLRMPDQKTGRLTPTAPAKTPRITPNSSIPPQTAGTGNAASAVYCRYCGKPLVQGRQFCGYCGRQVG